MRIQNKKKQNLIMKKNIKQKKIKTYNQNYSQNKITNKNKNHLQKQTIKIKILNAVPAAARKGSLTEHLLYTRLLCHFNYASCLYMSINTDAQRIKSFQLALLSDGVAKVINYQLQNVHENITSTTFLVRLQSRYNKRVK